MKKFLLYLFAIFLVTGCSNEIPEKKYASRKGRTVLAYLISNNKAGISLDEYLKENIVWMYEGLSAMEDTCTLLVYFRPYTSDNIIGKPAILEFNSDGHGRINGQQVTEGTSLTPDYVLTQAIRQKEYDDNDHNATDPEVMKTVLSDMKTIAPSDSYGLIFGSHGTGWMQGDHTIAPRSFGDDNRYSINIPEMAEAIQSAFPEQKADFILFDACMMGTAEVCYELRNVTSYCVASVLETPVSGLPYNRFFSELYEKEVNFAHIIDQAIAYNTEKGTWGAYAAIDCSQMDGLAQAVNEELQSKASQVKSINYTDGRSLLQYGYYNPYNKDNPFRYFSFDMVELIKVLNNGTLPPAFLDAFNATVLYKNSMSDPYYLQENSRYGGLGMYLPDRGIKSSWDEYYRSSISWYNAAGWDLINE